MKIVERKLRDSGGISKRKADFSIEGYSTKETAEKVNDKLRKIDRVTRVIHYRDSEKRNFVTYILGIRGAIRIVGGLTSGDCLEGSVALQNLLVSIGFDSEEVEGYITNTFEGVTAIEFIDL